MTVCNQLAGGRSHGETAEPPVCALVQQGDQYDWGGESREKTGGRLDANSVPGAGVAFRSNYLSLNGLDTASTAGLEDSETEYADPRIDALLSPTHFVPLIRIPI